MKTLTMLLIILLLLTSCQLSPPEDVLLEESMVSESSKLEPNSEESREIKYIEDEKTGLTPT